MSDIIIAIDVGKKGGICVRSGSRIQTAVMPVKKGQVCFPEIAQFLLQFKGNKQCVVVFEKLRGIKGASKTSTWSLAEQTGVLKGICVATGIRFVEIPPKTWQKEMFAGVEIIKRPSRLIKGQWVNDTKAMALKAFKNKFPHSQYLAFPGKKKMPHDGIVDAALISEFARKKGI